MISFEDALSLIDTRISPLSHESRPLSSALPGVLSEPLMATLDFPHFDNSAMDGYGLRASDSVHATVDSPVVLKVLETIQAGEVSEAMVESGSAVKILTGAPVPRGVDAVVMKEHCRSENGTVWVQRKVTVGENIRFKGEASHVGQTVLPEETPITPAVLGLFASYGLTAIPTFKRPRVCVVTTGNELVPPGQALQAGQIYDSNTVALQTAVIQLGCPCEVFSAIPDAPEILEKTLAKALENTDVLITVGGVSVGDYDFVQDVLDTLGAQKHFWKIAIKPGKPVLFASIGQKHIFALPGNPVSALVMFYTLVRPALLKLQGYPFPPLFQDQAVLETPLHKKPGRTELVRAFTTTTSEGKTTKATLGQDSHMLGGLATANSLLYFPTDHSEMRVGDMIRVEMMQWT